MQIKSKGLESKYRNGTNFRFLIKCVLCTVFIPKDFRKDCLKKLIQSNLIDYKEKTVKDFCEYYLNNWFNTNNFNNHDLERRIILDIPLTNNGAEGFNSSLNKELKAARPSLVEVLMCLRDRDFFQKLECIKI